MTGTPLPAPILAMLALALLAHGLLMTSGRLHDDAFAHRARPAIAARPHIHLIAAFPDGGRHPTPDTSVATSPVPGRASWCSPVRPWQPENGSGGDRPVRVSPVILLPLVTDVPRLAPHEPGYQYPPSVRRALLQVYRN